MKNLFIAFLLICSTHSFAQIKSATLIASGLTCSMCSKSIYKSVTKLPFVKDVVADVEKSSFEITFKEGSKPSFDEVKKAVQDAGFSVASLTAVIFFNNETISNNAGVTVGGANLQFINVSTQILNGDKTIKVVDKNYLPAKEYKKQGEHKDVNTTKRIYHVTI